jgi:hypothetical protein
MRNSLDKHGGLTASCARQHQKRPVDCVDRLALHAVQALIILIKQCPFGSLKSIVIMLHIFLSQLLPHLRAAEAFRLFRLVLLVLIVVLVLVLIVILILILIVVLVLILILVLILHTVILLFFHFSPFHGVKDSMHSSRDFYSVCAS